LILLEVRVALVRASARHQGNGVQVERPQRSEDERPWHRRRVAQDQRRGRPTVGLSARVRDARPAPGFPQVL